MSPGARRILIPIIVVGLALGVVFAGWMTGRGPGSPGGTATTPAGAVAADADKDKDAGTGAGTEAGAEAGAGTEADPGAGTEADAGPQADADADKDADAAAVFTKLLAVAPERGTSGHDVPPATLGSLDPREAPFLIEFSRTGAGIERITFSDIWERAKDRRQASAHNAALARGETPKTPLPPDDARYVLEQSEVLTNEIRTPVIVPTLSARYVYVNGAGVSVFDFNKDRDGKPESYVWAETAPGAFETTIVDETDTVIARIVRRYAIDDDFGITLAQRLFNLTDRPLTVKWIQDGPRSLRIDRSRYMDRRRARFGYLEDERRDPNRGFVLADDNSLLLEWTDLMKAWKKALQTQDETERRELLRLWPNRTSLDKDYELSWFAQTNRYFALTVHPALDEQGRGPRSLAALIDEITLEVSAPDGPATPDAQKLVFTYLWGREQTVAPGGELVLDLAAYAGPLDGHVLSEQPYAALSMHKLILFQMSSMCAVCTFQWLAYGLHDFLSFLHGHVLFDWGLAIITLVVLVRTLLHPLTRRSQISMQRFGKQMSAMKPELDKLQKKFPNDPKRLQQEQMKLMREHGANPLQMLGCLPMFLQTPIWIALYAMLYFTFELRQDPAFFGIFQKISGGAWPFLADLSSADHFFGELDEPVKFLMWNVTGFNLLPFLMGVIFFIQQKYMSPPPSPTMTADQMRQQKIMKVMMVVLFPLMLYSAPSGLTLYILTSSCIGILESRYIRRHISEMDLNPPKKKEARKVKPKDAQGRAFAAAIERREQERKRRAKPVRSYKKRK